MARKFLIEQKILQPQHCPPMLSVGQVATIAWLLKDKALEPEKAGRELLANCFAAVRPDHEWFKYFREGIEKVTGSIEEYGDDPKHAMALQAARRIAQEESFGESAIVRELNMVEILQRAEAEAGRVWEKKDAEIAAKDAQAVAVREEAVQAAIVETKRAERNARLMARADRARGLARISLNFIKGCLVIVFIGLSIWASLLQQSGKPSLALWILTAVFAFINVLSLMDLLRVPVAEGVLRPIERSITRRWESILMVLDGEEPPAEVHREPKP